MAARPLPRVLPHPHGQPVPTLKVRQHEISTAHPPAAWPGPPFLHKVCSPHSLPCSGHMGPQLQRQHSSERSSQGVRDNWAQIQGYHTWDKVLNGKALNLEIQHGGGEGIFASPPIPSHRCFICSSAVSEKVPAAREGRHVESTCPQPCASGLGRPLSARQHVCCVGAWSVFPLHVTLLARVSDDKANPSGA